MADIFDEVEEDLRADRMQQLAKRYGGLLTGAALLVVAGVGGWQGWQWWEGRQAAEASTQFIAAGRAAEAEGADYKAVGEQFRRIAAEAPPGYRLLARLRAAALLSEGGDTAAALAIWDEMSRDSGIDQLYRDLATLLWGLHAASSAEPATVRSRLQPLAANGAWKASAREVLALLAIRQGDNDAARRDLQALSNDQAVPQGIRDRASRLLAGIGS